MYAYKVTLTYKDDKNLFPVEVVKYVQAKSKDDAFWEAGFLFWKQTKTYTEQYSAKRIPLWVNEYVIQEHWGRWEDATSEDDPKEARARLREYRQNSRVSVRMITRKVINPLVENR